MNLTAHQALQKAIEAHKAGRFVEAERYYAAILKAQPKHPDANQTWASWLLVLVTLKRRYRFLRLRWVLIGASRSIG